MNRYMVLSAIAAAAIHGGVLFTWPRGSAPIPSPAVTRVIDIVYPPPTHPEDPDPVRIDDTVEQAPKGKPRPVSDETVVVAAPTDFPVPITPRLPISVPTGLTSLNEPIGVPGGTENLRTLGILPADLLDNSPRTRSQIAPFYPYPAKRDGVTGTVHVEFTVDESGRVLDPRIVTTTNPVFNDATIQAVLKWRFEPGRRDGKIVRFKMVVPIVFNLD